MSGGGQGASRVSVSHVEADLAAAREEIAGLRAELDTLRGQVADIAVAVAPRLSRLARRRGQAAANE